MKWVGSGKKGCEKGCEKVTRRLREGYDLEGSY